MRICKVIAKGGQVWVWLKAPHLCGTSFGRRSGFGARTVPKLEKNPRDAVKNVQSTNQFGSSGHPPAYFTLPHMMPCRGLRATCGVRFPIKKCWFDCFVFLTHKAGILLHNNYTTSEIRLQVGSSTGG